MNLKTFFLAVSLVFGILKLQAQCGTAYIQVDGNRISTDETSPKGVKLPLWLASGQTIEIGQDSYSISILQFDVTSGMVFDSVLSVTTPARTVPGNKAWKVESILKQSASSPASISGSTTYNTFGTYSWRVPQCVYLVNVEIWGAGGAGADGDTGPDYAGGGGGGGAYAYGNYEVTPGSMITIVVGEGGRNAVSQPTTNGEASSFGAFVTANGGTGGNFTSGGDGGVATGTFIVSVDGEDGENGSSNGTSGGDGGDTYNYNGNVEGEGGRGAFSSIGGDVGGFPGAGGGGGSDNPLDGRNGADGQVIISW